MLLHRPQLALEPDDLTVFLTASAVGLSGLIYVWVRFFRAEDGKSKPPLENMIGISLIGCTVTGFGIWEWVRTLRISN
jgi:hypothetical protein